MASGKHKERDLFSVKATDVHKSRKKRKKQGKNEGNRQKKQRIDDPSAVQVQPLTYGTMIAGQVILGCVQEVHNYELRVSLPYKLVGSVTIAQISKAYTALLTKVKDDDDDAETEIHTLQELFRPGQYIVTRVISVEDINGRYKVNLTLMPQEVNFSISASHLQVGYILPCAVSSVEEKGFVMDTGIANIRGAFLKNTKIDGSGIVGVGSTVRCIIEKILGDDEAGSLRLILSADSKAVSGATLDITDTTNLSLLLPGTAIKTTISKVQKQSLNLLLAGFDGVVSRLHLKYPFDQLSEYKLAQKVKARVLYITPLTKVVHFTLQKTICGASLDVDPLHGFKIGDRIEDAEIYEARANGLSFKIGDKCRGFASGNQLIDNDITPEHITSAVLAHRVVVTIVLTIPRR